MSYTCGTGDWSGPLPGDPSNDSILTATPVFGGIDVSWSPAIVNPHAVAHTYLYRSNSSDFVTAIRIATVGGTHFYDKLENLLTYYYWIQILSINGTLGEVIGPASAIPRLSIDATIEALTGRIDNGVLAQSLKSEIDRISLIDGDLYQEIQDRIAANELLGAAIQAAQTDASQAVSLLNEEITQRTTAYNVLLQTLNTMAGQVNDNKAAIETETTLRISNDEALAQQITNVQSATEDNLAAVQTTLQTNINTVNEKVTDIGALYTAKVQVNGLIGGFGVYNDGTEVQAGFDVDTFWVGRTGSDKKKPFIIDSATGETYIDKAVIPTLTADMIDTKGLSIKDMNGNVILSAGTALDWSRIGGTGKPENGATVGASIATSFSTWDLGDHQFVVVPDGKVGSSALRLSAGGGYPTQTSFVPIDPTKKYRVRFWARPSSDCNGLFYFSLRQAINETGTWGPVNGGRAPYKPSAQTRAAHNATYGTDVWGEYSYIWDATDWQVGVKFFRPEFLDNYGGTAGYWEVQGLVIEEATDIEAAKTAASAAQIAANNANNTLADIAADNKLTAVEKQSAANEWGIINRERASIQAQASALGISSELGDYNYTYAVLNDYITPLLQDISSTSVIDGATFRDKWSYFYEYRQRLMNKMSAVAATKADWANVQGSGKPLDNSGRVIDGDRFTNYNPADFPPGETFYFKEAASVGVTGGGTYGVLRTVRPYGSGTDLSGGSVFQWFEADQLVWARKSTSASTWSAWQRVPNETITTSNVTTYIADAALGNAQIGGNLWSTNWNYAGGTGWLLDRSGNFYGNNIYARGDIEASSLKANTAMVNTLHIQGDAVTVPVSAFTAGAISANSYPAGWSTVVIQTAWIDAGGSPVFVTGTCAVFFNSNISSFFDYFELVAPSGAVITRSGRVYTNNGYSDTVSISGVSYEAGTYQFRARTYLNASYSQSSWEISYRGLSLLGTKR